MNLGLAGRVALVTELTTGGVAEGRTDAFALRTPGGQLIERGGWWARVRADGGAWWARLRRRVRDRFDRDGVTGLLRVTARKVWPRTV